MQKVGRAFHLSIARRGLLGQVGVAGECGILHGIMQVRARELIRALERAGWIVTRTRGSHVIMKHDGNTVSIPVHSGGKMLADGTLQGILKRAGLTENELRALI